MGRPKFLPGETTSAPWVNIKGDICHEYDYHGQHRLTHNGASGDWVSYSDVATHKIGDRLFAATTDYWDNQLPEIFEIQTVVPRSLRDVYREEE